MCYPIKLLFSGLESSLTPESLCSLHHERNHTIIYLFIYTYWWSVGWLLVQSVLVHIYVVINWFRLPIPTLYQTQHNATTGNKLSLYHVNQFLSGDSLLETTVKSWLEQQDAKYNNDNLRY